MQCVRRVCLCDDLAEFRVCRCGVCPRYCSIPGRVREYQLFATWQTEQTQTYCFFQKRLVFFIQICKQLVLAYASQGDKPVKGRRTGREEERTNIDARINTTTCTFLCVYFRLLIALHICLQLPPSQFNSDPYLISLFSVSHTLTIAPNNLTSFLLARLSISNTG